jgi:hypothetical protein
MELTFLVDGVPKELVKQAIAAVEREWPQYTISVEEADIPESCLIEGVIDTEEIKAYIRGDENRFLLTEKPLLHEQRIDQLRGSSYLCGAVASTYKFIVRRDPIETFPQTIVHEIGHWHELNHCHNTVDDLLCVMAGTKNFFGDKNQLKNRGERLCEDCKAGQPRQKRDKILNYQVP